MIDSHNDEARFWREIGPILDDCNGDQGFCVGLICAAAILNPKAPYPVRDVLLLAAAKDRRAFFDAMLHGRRKAQQ